MTSQDPSATKKIPFIVNTGGEAERESRSRKFNVIEAFFLMTLLLVVLWYVQYFFCVLGTNEALNTGVSIFLTVAGLYCLFGSPFIHRDTLNSWGLGNPVALWRRLYYERSTANTLLAAVIVILIAVLSVIGFIQWPEVAKFLFRMKRERALAVMANPLGKVGISAFVLLLSTFLCTFFIRYDNFVSAFITVLKILVPLGGALYLLAFAVMGTAAFADFHITTFALGVFGYVFWGAVQQLLFCSYFGTRLRKGFAPARRVENQWKVRLAVSILNGAFFGIIHINSWMLVLVCWVLGSFLSWVFMDDRNRNLVALGFIHGFLGSSVGWLFNRSKAGGFEIKMGVGPTHVHGFDLLTICVVTVLIISFSLFMLWVLWKWPTREESTFS
ncbi:MAG: hypothetical protein GX117_08895 [Candidatus Hydrogenedentes bacterium]|nr:hypothetical protein [Candidatus Hydrogenedentota bacterium]